MTFGLVEQIAHYKAVKHRLFSKASYEETERAKAIKERRQRLKETIEAWEAKTKQAAQAKAAEAKKAIEEGTYRIPFDMARTIIKEVAAKHGMVYGEIVGPRRNKEVVRARYEAIVEVDNRFREAGRELSLPEIGRFFGGRDHSTVFTALRKMGVPKRGPRSPETPLRQRARRAGEIVSAVAPLIDRIRPAD